MVFSVVVAGSRGFADVELLDRKLSHLLVNRSDICIISGGARGADSLGEQWALANNHKVLRMPADWDLHGKSAGYKRNVEMAEAADACVIFWDGESRGSQHMINICEHREIPLRVIKY
jgi:hypothetical protein|tara:strand:+ start:281 stop:634 length:354 start_codon:yes stop_codon:yes gene_type:complete